MAKRERIPPLLECRIGVLTSFPAQIELSRKTDDNGFFARPRATPPGASAVIALKGSIGLVPEPYVTSVVYIASREERKSFSCGDTSSCVRFVPIRDDPEMVVNLGLRAAEAGLRRLGVAA
jgi:hypothetical protein